MIIVLVEIHSKVLNMCIPVEAMLSPAKILDWKTTKSLIAFLSSLLSPLYKRRGQEIKYVLFCKLDVKSFLFWLQ